ncbi:hypothetical protein D9756_007989 [Leucocoprinus leucothites]|uniref:Uncharacterized protein n=1 Tax=Leucocoprinus leucothites TaxID=201217 RepID=A0A8H5FYD8_9AGAR|nr:hypothetical protein D9756_007989 [Leucoagaricus leucothites]
MQALSLRTKAGSSLVSRNLDHQLKILPSNFTRSVSTSPYGRTHVWKRRPPVLPNPVVPKYPQTIIRSDGSSFVHWTTSPKSMVRLTRDTTNNPVWNTANWASDRALDEETGSAGRMGRFNRKFGGVTISKEEVNVSKKEGKGKKEVEVKKEEETVAEDMVDLTGMGMGMHKGGMGGVLDDVSWFEQMADLTGGEAQAPGKGKKKKKKD